MLDVILPGALRVVPSRPGRFTIVRMYGLQPPEATTLHIRQAGVNFPLRATPTAGSVGPRAKHQLRYGSRQQAEPGFTFLQILLADMLRRSITHDFDEAIPGRERHHQA